MPRSDLVMEPVADAGPYATMSDDEVEDAMLDAWDHLMRSPYQGRERRLADIAAYESLADELRSRRT